MEKCKIFIIVASVLICLGLLFTLIGLGSTEWLKIDIGFGKRHEGLWRTCFSNDGASICSNLPSSQLTSWQRGTQAMILLGSLTFIGASIALALVYCLPEHKLVLFLATAVGSGVAALFLLVGIIVYGAEVGKLNGLTLGYSFALTIIGFLFALGAACVMAAVLCMPESEESTGTGAPYSVNA